MQHLDIKIYGFVQGVNFRYYAKEKADELGIFGFIQNKPDGSVYIEAESDREALEKFLEWCKKGPPSAQVSKVNFNFSSNLKNFSAFKIK